MSQFEFRLRADSGSTETDFSGSERDQRPLGLPSAGCGIPAGLQTLVIEKSALIHINSYPGVGKLTIGRALADRIGGKLLDNHSIYNVAFALTEFRSPAFYDAVRAVRDLAYQRVLELPATLPVVLTNWYSQGSTWGEENWDEAISLAHRRPSPLAVVVLTCSPEENMRRIQNSGRDAMRKPRSVKLIASNQGGRPLIDRGGDRLLRLDVTEISADSAATSIAKWLAE